MAEQLEKLYAWIAVNYNQDITNIDMLQQVFMDDDAFAGEMLDAADITISQIIRKLGDDGQNRDASSLYIQVHSLRSTAATLGMENMAGFLQEMELKLKNKLPVSASDMGNLQQVARQALTVVHAIREQLKRNT
jgi:HPt (histidine-containing phosphotransfer) domain-containing protein